MSVDQKEVEEGEGAQLRRDEDLRTGDAGLADRAADLFLVLCGGVSFFVVVMKRKKPTHGSRRPCRSACIRPARHLFSVRC
jgi:hypothetical protein